MEEKIQQIIEHIETDYDVKVLYACESGSRVWGFPSDNSDYDVRFIYIHKTDWYLSIDQKRDVLEIPSQDTLSLPIDSQLDLSGWELTKVLRLFRKSNPPLLEQLHSSIVYYHKYSTINKMNMLEKNVFSPITCIHHYLNMASGNYRDFLKSEIPVTKKLINVIRPLLAAKWVEANNSVPPTNFQSLLKAVVHSTLLTEEIYNVITLKMEGTEFLININLDLINQFVEREYDHLKIYVKQIDHKLSDPTLQLNKLFRDTLLEVW
ncbi:nucleotidyltransferase domain-containing protein [Bacillus sp. HMF5848]|uniref:nucleotidyltransferase domain-containing protein n=1 Tax=Bacillus sp. HMF5848 TaxID=2495421 RepID=UPI000F7AF1A9|nr:nucleotidyltransferase domain-containing protein [Bacillus sp. HMF5848]RSK27512.1 nucleotidyltransferase domain-containing protein [Bacillus sp. HMF5848]